MSNFLMFQPKVPYYRLTLRKRNVAQNNELQDISFNYVIGKGELFPKIRKCLPKFTPGSGSVSI